MTDIDQMRQTLRKELEAIKAQVARIRAKMIEGVKRANS